MTVTTIWTKPCCCAGTWDVSPAHSYPRGRNMNRALWILLLSTVGCRASSSNTLMGTDSATPHYEQPMVPREPAFNTSAVTLTSSVVSATSDDFEISQRTNATGTICLSLSDTIRNALASNPELTA